MQSTAGLKLCHGNESPVWLDPGHGVGLAAGCPHQGDWGCAAPLSTAWLTVGVNSAPRTTMPSFPEAPYAF